MIFYVYKHIRLDDDTVFYVGKGRGLRAYEIRRRNKYWKNIVALTSYRVEIIKYFEHEADAYQYEFDLIINLKSKNQCQANFMIGGYDGKPLISSSREYLRFLNLGKKLSNDTKFKMSRSCMGRVNSNQARIKMSKSHTGKILKDSTIELISLRGRGLKRPQHMKDGVSKALKGRPNKFKGHKIIKFKYITPSGIFFSSREAASNNNCSQRCLLNRIKSARFEFYIREVLNG